MTNFRKKIAVVTFVISQIASYPALCAIPRTDMTIDFTKVTPIESLRTFTSADVAMVIPSDMAPSNDTKYVTSHILDHSLRNFFKSPEVRNTPLGRSAQQLENLVEQDISFGGTEKDSVKHVVKFSVKPMESKAQLNYTGFVKAQLSYQVSQQQLNLEVFQTVASATDLVATHSDSPLDRRDVLSLRYQW